MPLMVTPVSTTCLRNLFPVASYTYVIVPLLVPSGFRTVICTGKEIDVMPENEQNMLLHYVNAYIRDFKARKAYAL